MGRGGGDGSQRAPGHTDVLLTGEAGGDFLVSHRKGAPSRSRVGTLPATIMTPSFRALVSAITYSILRERCGATLPASSRTLNRISRYVADCHAGLPDPIRWTLLLATLGIDGSTLLTQGRPLHALPHRERWRRIEGWRTSRLGPLRNLLRFYEGLAIFGWYGEAHGDLV